VNSPCNELLRYQNLELITHLYFYGEKYKSKGDSDVTLVTQLNTERLYMVNRLCDHWSGPISVALYVYEEEMSNIFLFVRQNISKCENIAIHIAYHDLTLHFYPYNHLRNIALKQVTTPFVYLLDADFIPVKTSYETIRSFLEHKFNQNDYFLNQILVIPAFEINLTKFVMPQSKNQLISLWESNIVRQFDLNIFIYGHRPTNYTLWKRATTPYKFCIHSFLQY